MNPTESSEIECPHCGENFYYELTRCPRCKRRIYPSDFDDYEDEDGETEAEGWGINPEGLRRDSPSDHETVTHPLTGVLTGGFISGFIGVIFFFILSSMFSKSSANSLNLYLSLASVPIGAFVGGYVAAAFNGKSSHLSGLIIGVLSIGEAILLTAYQYDLATEPLIRPETVPWWGITILAGWGGAALSYRTTQRKTVRQFFKPRSESELYTELLTKVQFDHLTAESLIAFEQKRNPHGSRLTWIQNAIDRWQRDNRISS